MLVFVKNWRVTLSWKLGFRRGKSGRAYRCPWWVDKVAYRLAFMQGEGIEIPFDQPSYRSHVSKAARNHGFD
jgi:hypothetical protein